MRGDAKLLVLFGGIILVVIGFVFLFYSSSFNVNLEELNESNVNTSFSQASVEKNDNSGWSIFRDRISNLFVKKGSSTSSTASVDSEVDKTFEVEVIAPEIKEVNNTDVEEKGIVKKIIEYVSNKFSGGGSSGGGSSSGDDNNNEDIIDEIDVVEINETIVDNLTDIEISDIYISSSNFSGLNFANKTFDGNISNESFWLAEGTSWLQFDFNSSVTMDEVEVFFSNDSMTILNYSLELFVNDSWKMIFQGNRYFNLGYQGIYFNSSDVEGIRLTGYEDNISYLNKIIEVRFLYNDSVILGFVENESIVEIIPNCSDGILNQDEVVIDCGGVCGICVVAPEENETGVNFTFNSSGDFTFIVHGDTQTNAGIHSQIVSYIEGVNPDLIFNVGDMTYEGCDLNLWEQYREIVKNICVNFQGISCNESFEYLSSKYFPAIGNHDSVSSCPENYFNNYPFLINSGSPERYYSFGYNNSYFIVLDSTLMASRPGAPPSETVSPQTVWLEERLQIAQNFDFIFLFFHHPPESRIIQNWVPLFEEYGVDFIFNGHMHYYARSFFNSSYYVISGGGGGNLEDVVMDEYIIDSERAYHYIILDVSSENVTYAVYDIENNLIDGFIYSV